MIDVVTGTLVTVPNSQEKRLEELGFLKLRQIL